MEIKEFLLGTSSRCETTGTGIINKAKQEKEKANLNAQVAAMNAEVQAEIAKRLSAEDVRKLISQNPDCNKIKDLKDKGKVDKNVMLTFTVGDEVGRQVLYSTIVNNQEGNVAIDNIGSSFPNSIISIDVDS